MSEIIAFNTAASGTTISVDQLVRNNRKLAAGLIAPAVSDQCEEIAIDHAADPIKSMDDIERIQDYFIRNERWRDNMLFIVGINFGLRISDLLTLRFSNLINENMTFKDSFAVFEKKTRNTRKRKKNRYITINNAVIEAVTLYLQHTPGVTLSDYMFNNISYNKSKSEGCKPITAYSVNRMLHNLSKELDLNMRLTTHSLRKTFCYWMMVYGHNDSRRLLLLQKMLNHSSPAQTLDYIGLTQEEIHEAYKELNLCAGRSMHLVDSSIFERDAV